MANAPLSLAIVYRNSYVRTNEQDGSTYRVYCYRVLKSNPNAVQLQFAEDVQASGYNVLHDDDTNEMIFRSTRPVPPNCPIIRTQAGKWVADTAQMDMLNDMAKRYPHLYGGVGEALAKELLGRNRSQQVPDTNPEQKPQDENIDPFAG